MASMLLVWLSQLNLFDWILNLSMPFLYPLPCHCNMSSLTRPLPSGLFYQYLRPHMSFENGSVLKLNFCMSHFKWHRPQTCTLHIYRETRQTYNIALLILVPRFLLHLSINDNRTLFWSVSILNVTSIHYFFNLN